MPSARDLAQRSTKANANASAVSTANKNLAAGAKGVAAGGGSIAAAGSMTSIPENIDVISIPGVDYSDFGADFATQLNDLSFKVLGKDSSILHNYNSYNYNITLSSLSAKEANDPKSYIDKVIFDSGIGGSIEYPGTYIVARSGGYGRIELNPTGGFNDGGPTNKEDSMNKDKDLFIDNLQFQTVMAGVGGAYGGNMTKGSFEITEPHGVGGFYEELYNAANYKGHDSYLSAPFLMTISFIGRKVDNKTGENIVETVPKATRYFPIIIQNSTMKVDEKGARYSVNFVARSHMESNKSIYTQLVDNLEGADANILNVGIAAYDLFLKHNLAFENHMKNQENTAATSFDKPKEVDAATKAKRDADQASAKNAGMTVAAFQPHRWCIWFPPAYSKVGGDPTMPQSDVTTNQSLMGTSGSKIFVRSQTDAFKLQELSYDVWSQKKSDFQKTQEESYLRDADVNTLGSVNRFQNAFSQSKLREEGFGYTGHFKVPEIETAVQGNKEEIEKLVKDIQTSQKKIADTKEKIAKKKKEAEDYAKETDTKSTYESGGLFQTQTFSGGDRPGDQAIYKYEYYSHGFDPAAFEDQQEFQNAMFLEDIDDLKNAIETTKKKILALKSELSIQTIILNNEESKDDATDDDESFEAIERQRVSVEELKQDIESWTGVLRDQQKNLEELLQKKKQIEEDAVEDVDPVPSDIKTKLDGYVKDLNKLSQELGREQAALDLKKKQLESAKGSYDSNRMKEYKRYGKDRTPWYYKKGSTLESNLHQIILDSKYSTELAEGQVFDKIQLTKYIPWYRIEKFIKQIGYDTFFHAPVYEFHYIVSPFEIHYSKLAAQYGMQGEYDYDKAYKNAVREYNYIFTGKNVDVMNFNLDFNNTFMQVGAKTKSAISKGEVAKTSEEKKEVNKNTAGLKSLFDKLNKVGTTQAGALTQASGSTGGAGGDTSNLTLIGKQLHDALYNTPGERALINAKMEIIGDPVYLISSGIDDRAQLRDEKETVNGEANIFSRECDVIFNFRFPGDYPTSDELNGGSKYVANPQNSRYSGLYKVTLVENLFNEGVFQQSLQLVRRPNQKSDYAQPVGSKGPELKSEKNPMLSSGDPAQQDKMKEKPQPELPKDASKLSSAELDKVSEIGPVKATGNFISGAVDGVTGAVGEVASAVGGAVNFVGTTIGDIVGGVTGAVSGQANKVTSLTGKASGATDALASAQSVEKTVKKTGNTFST